MGHQYKGPVRIIDELRKQGINPLLIIVEGDFGSDYHTDLSEKIDHLDLKGHVFLRVGQMISRSF
ncbi:MAG: hypothetical protein ACMUIM_07550 [bacterium]